MALRQVFQAKNTGNKEKQYSKVQKRRQEEDRKERKNGELEAGKKENRRIQEKEK